MNVPLLRLTCVGGPTCLLEFGGVRLLTDPTFDLPQASTTTRPVTLRKVVGPAISGGGVADWQSVDCVSPDFRTSGDWQTLGSTYQIHPHVHRTLFCKLGFCRTALQTAHSRIHIIALQMCT